jgi:hypothetical protein
VELSCSLSSSLSFFLPLFAEYSSGCSFPECLAEVADTEAEVAGAEADLAAGAGSEDSAAAVRVVVEVAAVGSQRGFKWFQSKR